MLSSYTSSQYKENKCIFWSVIVLFLYVWTVSVVIAKSVNQRVDVSISKSEPLILVILIAAVGFLIVFCDRLAALKKND